MCVCGGGGGGYRFPAMFSEDRQTREHCFLAMFPEGEQTRKHCFPAMFTEGGQTKPCFLKVEKLQNIVT